MFSPLFYTTHTVPATDLAVQCYHAQENPELCQECTCQARCVHVHVHCIYTIRTIVLMDCSFLHVCHITVYVDIFAGDFIS